MAPVSPPGLVPPRHCQGAAPSEWELWLLEPQDNDLPTGLGTEDKEENMTQTLPSRAPVVGAVTGKMYNRVGYVLHMRRECCVLGAL